MLEFTCWISAKDMLAQLRKQGVITEEGLQSLRAATDAELEALDDQPPAPSSAEPKITTKAKCCKPPRIDQDH